MFRRMYIIKIDQELILIYPIQFDLTHNHLPVRCEPSLSFSESYTYSGADPVLFLLLIFSVSF